MKRITLFVLLALLIATFSSVTAQGSSTRYVINFKGNGIPSNAAALIEAAGGKLSRTLPEVGIAIATSSNSNFASALSANSAVSSAGLVSYTSVPDTAVVAAADAPTAADVFYNPVDAWGINRVNAPKAWQAGVTGSHSTVVAVIDTGIAWNHPDLGPNIVHKACFTSAGDHTTGACNPYPTGSDHGTHVAGTVAAAFGGGALVGVGPNLGLASYNTFEPIDGCGFCSYSDSRWAAMIDVANRGYEVINMSLGSTAAFGGKGSNELAAFRQAENKIADYVMKQGVVLVASTGNGNLDLNGTVIHFPGDVSGIINVGATGIRPEPKFPQPGAFDVRAFYSNYGAPVTLVGPGGDCGQDGGCNPATRPANWFEYLILSSVVAPNATCAANNNCPVGYGWKAGTSMATPHVAGVVGLLRSKNPGLSPKQVVARIKQSADSLGNRQFFGAGMVDAWAALNK